MLARTRNEREQGFTLIELLVVIIIIGVLAAVAIPVFLNQRKKANDAMLKNDLRALALAEETWITENPGFYGTTDATALKAAGFARSSNVRIYSSVNTSTGGYCLLARTANAQDSGGGSPMYMEYDSLMGGVLDGGKFRAFTLVNPGGGACGTGRGTFTEVV